MDYVQLRFIMVIFTCIFVFLTVVLSGLSTAFLSVSLLSNEWEMVTYKRDGVEKLAKMKNHTLQWLPQELGKLEIPTEQLENRSKKIENNTVIVYLIPAYGGVNSLCPNVTGKWYYY
ncbi:uncharacterized protein CDAR_400361 [Caerostris darwini]|uniref:Uncharacterized protein n=1 Tax=Caerostris darwini TaxID=1538125 RepID=A0AAV4VW03_9ARAC|nr:uncharacterized protein CDAR_400361 [Caerostris darwini]